MPENGIPTVLRGLNIVDSDAEILRLENIIRDGISPRIQGVSISPPVDVPSKGNIAFVIRIPKSWSSPHMVSFKGSSKFYSRNSAGKFPLDVDEIRSAFLFSETVAERIRDFRADRLSKIIAGETPVEVIGGAQAVLHLVPIGGFRPGTNLDLEALLRDSAIELYKRFHPYQFGHKRRNFDGLLVCGVPKDNVAEWYLQLFRNGCVEYIESIGSTSGEKHITHEFFEENFIVTFPRILSIQQFIGVELPIFIMLSLLGVKGYTILLNRPGRFGNDAQYIDRDQLIIPEHVLEAWECDAARTLKPLFDVVWNAAGWSGSRNYDTDGNWAPK